MDQKDDLFEDRAALLEAIISSSDDAILTKDLNGIIMSWNPAATRILGYAREEMIGQSVLRLIPLELHQEEPEILRKLRSGERIDHFETTRLKKNGEPLTVSLTISPLKNSAGAVIGASKVLRDISERKHMEAALVQAEKIAATGRMAATIAHEINNPLEGLMNLIFLARTSVSDPRLVVEYLTTAEGELNRIAHIAKQTLGFYREQASPVHLSLSTLTREALAIYEPRLKNSNIELRADLATTPPIVMRRGELMQSISNLVVNAIHAMPEGGILTVHLHPAIGEEGDGKSGGVLLTVEDTGVGIEPDNLSKIFEPFFTTRREIGNGIGLWVTRKFVEGHGGTVAAVSSVGLVSHGTKMSIFLPWENGYSSI